MVFYLLTALRRRLQSSINMAVFLDLVALGTVADLVTLDHNNRVFVQQGLKHIRAGRGRPGINALLKIAERPLERVTSQDLAFQVGPRLNAAGRLKTMDLGLACLLSNNPQQALEHAKVLDDLNRERRDIENTMREQAEIALSAVTLVDKLPLGLCLYDERWHQGVIGILASRLKELYHRPAIALALGEDGLVKGSARSIEGLHIRDVLVDIDSHYNGLLIRYGGHAMAAGLTLRYDAIAAFTSAFAEVVSKHLGGRLPDAEILSDGPLQSSEITVETARMLRYAGPWGQGFPPPLFDGEFKVRAQRLVGGVHLRLDLESADQRVINAICFRWGASLLNAERVYAAYRLDLNEYRGKESVQLIIEHLEPI